jgi:exodeoxyribonuclease VII large subunit
MLRVAQNRWPLVEITIFDVLVQGDSAKYSIVDAINYADTKEFDVLVVARGGGSKEDLWAFNERIVAESIFEAKTPVVSAVGHEIDTLISDYVADLRAPTPSAAMEMLLPDKNEMLMMLDSISSQYNHVFSQQLHHHKKVLIQLEAGYKRNSIEQKIKNNFDVINEFKQQLRTQVLHKIEMKKRELLPLHDTFSRHLKSVVQNKSYYLQQLQNSYELNKPSNKNKKGFVQISKESELIKL